MARLTSSRLPGKHFKLIGNRSLLWWELNQLKKSKEIDTIVLATAAEPENLPLKLFAEENGISCFWYEGPVNHVTTRLRRAAEKYEADICVLASGDCPLIYAPAIDILIDRLKHAPDADTISMLNDSQGQAPALEGIIVSRKRAWQLADDLADRPELKEHFFPVLGLRPERFRFLGITLPDSLCMPRHRLSVDTLADLEFMNTIHDLLAEKKKIFELPHVVAVLKEHPDLKTINLHVHQRRLVEDIKRILFIVDAGGEYGLGHLMRSMELGRQFTERLGWPVHFMVDDIHAKLTLEAAGHRVCWGAFGRATRLDSDNFSEESIQLTFSKYDLLIFDIFDQRGPDSGWRSQLPANIKCVVMENRLAWADESDLILFPNILFKQSSIPNDKTAGGESFVILRNAVRQLASLPRKKEIDILFYFHEAKRRKAFAKQLSKYSLKTKVIEKFTPEFASDLANARIFVSGFGVSFNEALALNTLPVCWPDSEAHRQDALAFYQNSGMPSFVLESQDDIENVILPLLANHYRVPKTLKDGTPNIVARIAALFKTNASAN